MQLETQKIINIILQYIPNVEAIYVFGSAALNQENKNSDVDIAILLPVMQAKEIGNLYLTDLHSDLMLLLKKEVDLINLRAASTVLQKEIISKGKVIFCANLHSKNEFEMLTISFYQRLNFERKEILEKFYG
ncbi:MAG: nucleotidyltransferase domain-containing protein [Pseudomonadota bacterium]